MLRINKALALGGLLALLAAAPAAAQSDDMRYRDHGVILYGLAGGYTPLTDLNAVGGDFETGFGLGAGIGYQINRNLALRGNLHFTQSQARAPSMPLIDGRNYDRYFYDVDLQVRYPTRVGLAPYVILGGGAVTLDPQTSGADSFTKLAGKVGAGLSYHFRESGTSLFAEWDGWFYDWDRSDVDRTQFDTAWSGGVRFTF